MAALVDFLEQFTDGKGDRWRICGACVGCGLAHAGVSMPWRNLALDAGVRVDIEPIDETKMMDELPKGRRRRKRSARRRQRSQEAHRGAWQGSG
jgi:hypothetical protein